ncbi:MAG: type I methionyl aminopeptidase [Cyanobacteria bacterium SIG30]|nr:type I methionyl aminopeptidase [Cyanobacteria bacterium SIG30]
MIHKKSREEIKLMKEAGRIVALVHNEMKNIIKPGISTYELDKIAHDIIRDNKAFPTFLGYNGFPATICASINEQVVHGIPSKDTILKDGDVISIDVGATFKGLVGDGAWTYGVGEINSANQKLLNATEEALMSAIKKIKNGINLDEVVGEIEDVAKANNLGIVRQYGGHGVGRNMHEEPFVFNYRTGSKVILKSNMAVAIEPMLNLGCDDVYVLEDDWTVVTKDHKPSAHFEHTILVTDDGAEILTKI